MNPNYISFDGVSYRLAELSKKQFKSLAKNSKTIKYGGFEIKAKFVKKHFKKLVKLTKFAELEQVQETPLTGQDLLEQWPFLIESGLMQNPNKVLFVNIDLRQTEVLSRLTRERFKALCDNAEAIYYLEWQFDKKDSEALDRFFGILKDELPKKLSNYLLA